MLSEASSSSAAVAPVASLAADNPAKPVNPSDPLTEEILSSGFFDETWGLPADPK